MKPLNQRRFLVTGLPRVRTAWMAALFSGDKVKCFHDAVHHGGVQRLLEHVDSCRSPIVGLLDPGAACVYPREAIKMFAGWPIVVVERNSDDSRTGLQNWFGFPLDNWENLESNFKWFLENIPTQYYSVPFDALDEFNTVNHLYGHCTGLSLDSHRFNLFNTLKIEQHRGKAANAAAKLRN